MLLEFLPDSAPILVLLTGKLSSMCFDISRALQTTNSSTSLLTYSDADHGGNPDNGRLTGGYVVKIGTSAVSWSSKLQTLVALSTTKVEHISAAGKEILWMRQILLL
jgi:hypothetical protein